VRPLGVSAASTIRTSSPRVTGAGVTTVIGARFTSLCARGSTKSGTSSAWTSETSTSSASARSRFSE
jgi:hypothetical protein